MNGIDTQERTVTRHLGVPDSGDTAPRAASRLRDRPAYSAEFGRAAASRRRITLPGVATAPDQGLGFGRMGHIGAKPSRAGVYVDRRRSETANRRDEAHGPRYRRDQPHYEAL